MERLSQLDRELMESMLEEHRTRWLGGGDLSAVAETVFICGHNTFPLPDWCVEPVLKGLELYNEHGGKGRAQSPRGKLEMRTAHETRHDLVKMVHDNPMEFCGERKVSLDRAFEYVATTLLKGKCITARTVKASYMQIERQTKK